jgi:ABC-type multidrug transport system fused ATPase/permease subunit
LEQNLDKRLKEYFRTAIETINQEQIDSDHVLSKKKKAKKTTELVIEETKEPEDEEEIKEKKQLRRKIVIESHLKMTKVSPTVSGFIACLERPIDKEEYLKIHEILDGVEHTVKELDEQAYIVLRPKVTSVVFTRGLVTKKNYWINSNGKTKRVSDLPALTEFKSGVVEYIVEFNNEEYYNILPEALGGNEWEEIEWEIKKEPFSNYSFSVMRSSIFRLVDEDRLEYLREIVVYNHPPSYDSNLTEDKFKEDHKSILQDLSDEQAKATYKSIKAKNFYLISGLPQSGKSTVLTSLLQIYRKTNLKVLVVSSKNNLLDELLLKAQEKDVSFVRVTNSPSQVHHMITETVRKSTGFKDSNELDEMLNNENIYASTCLGCQNALLGLIKPFDVCIVENAESISEAVVLGALVLCKKFIMAGNVSVKSDQVDTDRDNTLFTRLIDKHQNKMAHLSCTYIE